MREYWSPFDHEGFDSNMKILSIRRFVPENLTYTPGIFIYERQPFAVTLELPYKNNARGISCINTGEYRCLPYSSKKYPNTWQIMDVKGRDLILLHKANYLIDIKGCVAVGEKFTDINKDGVMDIGESNEGFNEFLSIVKGESEFKLIIERAGAWEV